MSQESNISEEKFVCVHGHFYQPPRENPWLEEIELQDSAYPFHDWNERIHAECYRPNAHSRILGEDGKIVSIENNYSRMSFDFGPALLNWLERCEPGTYESILEGDRESCRKFGGHGNAMAQPYEHVILPMISSSDRKTLIEWGLRDFRRRFRREAQGMWLPETAASPETLEDLHNAGIAYTILSPGQAVRIRRIGEERWRELGGGIDPTMPYRFPLGNNRSINLFFYDGPISHNIAFDNLLDNGEALANRMLGAFADFRTWNQLVHVATDGETYGHHHPRGEMALTYALHQIESLQLARVTNYSHFLSMFEPEYEVEIAHEGSWSCPHGFGRWREDCGCSTGNNPEFHQRWRSGLRKATVELKERVEKIIDDKAPQLFRDRERARSDYSQLLGNRNEKTIDTFLKENVLKESLPMKSTFLQLLELDRFSLRMFISSGWYFDDISGQEAVQCIKYAARVIQLARLFGQDLEENYLAILRETPTNHPVLLNGEDVYRELVQPEVVSLRDVGAHYAICSIFQEYLESAKIYSYRVTQQELHRKESGRARLVTGRCCVNSDVTEASENFHFAVLLFGDHTIRAGVSPDNGGRKEFESFRSRAEKFFDGGDYQATRELLESEYDTGYTVRSLFREEQRNFLDRLLKLRQSEVESLFRKVCEDNYPMMCVLIDAGKPLPDVFRSVSEFVRNTEIRRSISSETPDLDYIRALMDESRSWKLNLDDSGISYLYRKRLEEMTGSLLESPENVELMQLLIEDVRLAGLFPFQVDISGVQNRYYKLLKENYPATLDRSLQGKKDAVRWVELFQTLGALLSFSLEFDSTDETIH